MLYCCFYNIIISIHYTFSLLEKIEMKKIIAIVVLCVLAGCASTSSNKSDVTYNEPSYNENYIDNGHYDYQNW